MRVSFRKKPKELWFPQLWSIEINGKPLGHIQSRSLEDDVFYYLSSECLEIPHINTCNRSLTLAEAKREVREYIKKYI